MTRINIIIAFILSAYIIYQTRWFKRLTQKWRDQGDQSSATKPTMFDVRQLLIEGKKDEAIRVYTQLFKVSSGEARKAVEELERSIQPNDFGR